MLNKSFGTYLLMSVCYKKKIKIYYLFSIVLFNKETHMRNSNIFHLRLVLKVTVLHEGVYIRVGKCIRVEKVAKWISVLLISPNSTY
jgi:hypothetical protein